MANAKALIKQAEIKRGLSAWFDAFGSEPCVEIKPDGTLQMYPTDDRPKDTPNDWDDL